MKTRVHTALMVTVALALTACTATTDPDADPSANNGATGAAGTDGTAGPSGPDGPGASGGPTDGPSGAPGPSGEPNPSATPKPGLDWTVTPIKGLTRDRDWDDVNAILAPGGTRRLMFGTQSRNGQLTPMAWVGRDGDWQRKRLEAPDGGARVHDAVWVGNGKGGMAVGTGHTPDNRVPPPMVWRFPRGGDGSLVTTTGLPDQLNVVEVTHHPKTGWVVLGWADAQPHMYASPNGRRWHEVAPSGLGSMIDPDIVDLVATTKAIVIAVNDTVDGKVESHFLSGPATNARDFHITHDISTRRPTSVAITGIDVNGARILAVGRREDKAGGNSPMAWKGRPRAPKEHAPSIETVLEHTSFNPQGSLLLSVHRAGNRWVGSAYTAASNIVVTSNNGTSWREVPLDADVQDTEVPAFDVWGGTGAGVLGSSGDTVVRAGETVQQLLGHPLPVARDNVWLSAPTIDDDGLTTALVTERRGRDMAKRGAWSTTFGTATFNGGFKPGGTTKEQVVGDLATRKGNRILAVGYERFLEANYVDDSITATSWDSAVTRANETNMPSPADTNGDPATTRANEVSVSKSVAVAAGTRYWDRVQHPVFWWRDGPRWRLADDMQGASGTPGVWITDACPIHNGGHVVFGGRRGGNADKPMVWRTGTRGVRWELLSDGTKAFGAKTVALDGCFRQGDKLVVHGRVGTPWRAAVWITGKGDSWRRLKRHDGLGDDSWVSSGVHRNGVTVLHAFDTLPNRSRAAILTIDDGNGMRRFSLDVAQLQGSSGPATIEQVAIVRGEVVLLVEIDGRWAFATAPLP